MIDFLSFFKNIQENHLCLYLSKFDRNFPIFFRFLQSVLTIADQLYKGQEIIIHNLLI